MAEVVSYSHVTTASIPAAVWPTAWFTLVSWKSYLQSFPGYQEQRLSVRPLGADDVRVHIVTVWDEIEQLQAWVGSDWSAESLLSALDPPAHDVVSESCEDLA